MTKHTIPGWVPFHNKEPRGLAYETDTHFVHVVGRDRGLWTVSVGLTVTEAKVGTLRSWVDKTFGAEEIVELEHAAGQCTKGIWRPGLYFDDEIQDALEVTLPELRLAEQALLILIHRLDELLHFVEPASNGLDAYSHKARELLILSCTEVENSWASFLRIAGLVPPTRGFTTNDYVKLYAPLRLAEYEVSLPRYSAVAAMRPFVDWSSAQPTQSLTWYDAYNKTKHDKATYFSLATINNCILAVSANVVLFAVRFGPFRLMNGAGTLPAYFNQLLLLQLKAYDPKSSYVPLIAIAGNQRNDLICYGARDSVQPWTARSLSL